MMIYLDYAATTPMSEEALQSYMKAASQYFGNEQSLHDIGGTAASLLQVCRKTFAEMIGGKEQGVFFTSGGSESNYLAIQSLLNPRTKKHIITTPMEHASIRSYFQSLKSKGYTITEIPVDKNGLICLVDLEAAITEDTVLASIQHGNSEIGTVQNITEIGALLKKYNVLFHTDCVQTFGKLPIHVFEMGIDSLSVSAHKIYGPKGVGACYINPQSRWEQVFPGTSHEKGFRPGTVNVPGIASFLTAAENILKTQWEESLRFKELRSYFLGQIQTLPLEIEVEGHSTSCLPHIVGVTIKGIEGQYTMLECNRHGIAISTGSACQVGKQEPSKTMLAIGKTYEEAKQYVRFSFGQQTTKDQIDTTIHALHTIGNQFYRGVKS
ncbi:cysteine desulfurase [Bacillus thuringiensis serovar andalousiensis]|uniref:Cysteine desulfurase n=1 Tax=Bacillus thuringiensis TaxID=1428 RepID=A0A9X6Q129_BACTU|nr:MULTISPECIES: IscS subfamily cysteine desulfurase [Bacillus cereus group]MDA2612102.1 IscS subfamily cysteine desulfurase [Bacillus cereus]MDR5045206.1 aminotransferase class V-fold PLP-dependent enzyme [Bacillus thuringiensis]MEB8551386.1 IscS subfamily cysteine desulfurase [Bacillus cereus]MEB8649037.1 IscS subfamily cysteine desulfurase [Bacillus cereus]MEB8669431.1 IscS subfamily cysteine desulfurase [Bacillus cereus]